ncbi:MAG TPA: deoxyribonuclease IV [Thermomicrobiales bacterium]|nr:deoxyribonuclease IV [Thermomicrobiales bacterium]
MLELGAHMSISGGHDLALTRAHAVQMTSCQLFTKNASQWKAKPIDPAVIERFQQQREATGIAHLVAHDSYLINVASPDDALWEKSRLALIDELDRCDQLGVPYLVAHPGGHVGSGEDAGIARIAEAINRIHDERPEGQAKILLETTAGQGTHLGRTFEELAAIIDKVEDKSRVAVCFDTCHVFAAGYDLRDADVYEATMTAFDEIIGLDLLKVLHLNDSKKGLGSRVDRHAPIGEGELGLTAFELIMNDERLAGLPGVLETPKGDNDEEDARNMATLRSLIRQTAG